MVDVGGSFRPPLSFEDLRFARVPITRYSSRGYSYTKMVGHGMPQLPENYLNCVVYLYPDRGAANEGHDFGGTGFIVSVPSKKVTAWQWTYVVSNWHVVRDSPVVRINTKDGGTDIFEFDPSDWFFDGGGDDVAIAPLPIQDGVHKFGMISVGGFLTEKIALENRVGPGDDVFMIGRFIDHDGGQTNAPAVRFGNISTAPTEVRQPNGCMRPSYCLDMHSRTGYSGSPVFCYRTPGSDLEGLSRDGVDVGKNMLLLLGLHWGQFPEEWKLIKRGGHFEAVQSAKDGDKIRGVSGMTMAIPAWRILDLINAPHWIALRSEQEEVLAKKYASAPIAESAGRPMTGDAILKRMLNTPHTPLSNSGGAKKR